MAASVWSSWPSRWVSPPTCCFWTSPPPACRAPRATSSSMPSALLPAQIGVLIIEHDMDLVFRFATRITVLVGGGVFASGSPQEVAANPDVRAVYLGETHGR